MADSYTTTVTTNANVVHHTILNLAQNNQRAGIYTTPGAPTWLITSLITLRHALDRPIGRKASVRVPTGNGHQRLKTTEDRV